MSLEDYFLKLRQSNHAKLRMICFPYAGGNSSTYMSWANELRNCVELLAVELPGRSLRFSEPAHRSMDRLVDDLFAAFQQLTDKPYILMGHSLGSRVAFELMHKCKLHGVRMPEHFIASGSSAPHIKEEPKKHYQLPTEEFIEELRKLNGTPEEILGNRELMDLALPFIRADFELSETYSCTAVEKIDCPITVFHGVNDTEISQSDAQAWEEHFTHPAVMHVFPSDHFFIEKDKASVLDKVNFIIDQTANSGI
jgi:medium-chain acyl-[acyl-carrier-protein] hydrolase